ncbi:MAG: hypothetical protein IKC64_02215 [Clostridia bacterium]|nr:hypothetical protein [Clostridia bacterium]
MDNQQEIATPTPASAEDKQTNSTKSKPLILRLFFSGAISSETKTSKKIAYIAVMSAFLAVANMFEFKFADVQYSLTIASSALAGVVLGGAFGFVAAFLGDLVGFLYNSGGFSYMPWIGITMGVIALISGVVIGGINLKFRGDLLVKILIVAVSTFLIGTVGINTTAFYLLYGKGVPYFTYLFTRIIVGGQIYNSIANYALLFIIIPTIAKLNILKFNY